MADVVDLITQDHRELERLFRVLLDEPEKRAMTAPVMSTLLFAHSRAEEVEVYPFARDAGLGEDIEHSQKEHLVADLIAARLVVTDPTSAAFEQVLRELVETVQHHIDEEEGDVLPGMRSSMPSDDLERLAKRFLAARTDNLVGVAGGDRSEVTRAWAARAEW